MEPGQTEIDFGTHLPPQKRTFEFCWFLVSPFPGLACNYALKFFGGGRDASFQNMDSDATLIAKDATDTHKPMQTRCLRVPNPTEDVSDQDSSQNPEN